MRPVLASSRSGWHYYGPEGVDPQPEVSDLQLAVEVQYDQPLLYGSATQVMLATRFRVTVGHKHNRSLSPIALGSAALLLTANVLVEILVQHRV